jgi:hypothetical protein
MKNAEIKTEMGKQIRARTEELPIYALGLGDINIIISDENIDPCLQQYFS